jgi:hypothetical protein
MLAINILNSQYNHSYDTLLGYVAYTAITVADYSSVMSDEEYKQYCNSNES